MERAWFRVSCPERRLQCLCLFISQQDRIMVSLTSLLVLTGLLTQTSQSITKTAYLKLIDVWYIVFICIDFLIIVVLAVIEGFRQRVRLAEVKFSDRKALQGGQNPTVAWSPQTANSLAKRVNDIAIVLFPVVCVLFIIGLFFTVCEKFVFE